MIGQVQPGTTALQAPLGQGRLQQRQIDGPLQFRRGDAAQAIPIRTQFVPSVDRYAVKSLPRRVSRTQFGATPLPPDVWLDVPPVAVRRWKASPFAALTNIEACRAFAASDSRIITPALVHASTPWMPSTRAMISPSPVRARYAKRNSSSASAMPSCKNPSQTTG